MEIGLIEENLDLWTIWILSMGLIPSYWFVRDPMILILGATSFREEIRKLTNLSTGFYAWILIFSGRGDGGA